MQQAPQIKAIETTYNGIRFRSRLEARWAVFMDALGVKWEYEPEGFTNGELCYLPDFWLPKMECYLEIKPCAPSEEEIDKAAMLSEAGKTIYFMIGRPIHPDQISGVWMEDGGALPHDYPHYWFTCDGCGHVGIIYQYEGNYRNCCSRGGNSPCSAIYSAVIQANNYRFGGVA